MKTVLLVDDEELALTRLQTLVNWTELDCRIIGTASNAPTALQLIEKYNPDIVITDIVMPGTNGLGLIEQASGSFHGRFILISAYHEFSYAQQAIHMNVSDYLLKPYTAEQLRDAVIHCMGNETIGLNDYEKQYGAMVGKIMRAVDRHLFDPQLTLTWLCENELFMNETHSGRQFQKKAGMKFSTWVTQKRIREACRILDQNPAISITEVASMVGFSSENYFCEVFKKYMEMPPSQYRKGGQGGEDSDQQPFVD